MKRQIKFWIMVVAAVLMFTVVPAYRALADAATVIVTASVLGSCSFTTASTMDFGTMNPLSAANTNVNASLQFKCTLGTVYTITDNKGLHSTGNTFRMQHSTDNTQLIPYTFTYLGTGVGLGNSTPITLSITGAVLATDYADAKVGSYSDMVTLTITP